MHTYVYIYEHIFIHVCVYPYTSTCTFIYIHLYVHIPTFACLIIQDDSKVEERKTEDMIEQETIDIGEGSRSHKRITTSSGTTYLPYLEMYIRTCTHN